MSTDSSFRIRAASQQDAKAVRMLLSGAAESLSHCFVAEAGEPARVVAAGGLTTAYRAKPLPGPGVTVHVIPPCRGQGIARRLLDGLVEISTSAGAKALFATQKVDLDGEEQRAWAALSFIPCETVQYHELPLEQFELELAPLLERMQQKGKIPKTAQIIPLFEAEIDSIVRLHLEVLGGDAASLLRKLRGEVSESFSARYSKVLLLDGQTVGFILGHRVARDVVHVDANVVAPDVRGGWANVWLKLEATREAIPWGIRKFVFTTFDHYSDTRSFTDRLQGVTVQTKVLMYRPLSQA
jgi:GNAT superfamily N-acetyltransferase